MIFRNYFTKALFFMSILFITTSCASVLMSPPTITPSTAPSYSTPANKSSPSYIITPQKVWTINSYLSSQTWSPDSKTFFIFTPSEMFAFDALTLEKLWNMDYSGGFIPSGMIDPSGTLLFLNSRRFLKIIPQTGEIIRENEVSNTFEDPCAIINVVKIAQNLDDLYMVIDDDRESWLGRNTELQLWQQNTTSQCQRLLYRIPGTPRTADFDPKTQKIAVGLYTDFRQTELSQEYYMDGKGIIFDIPSQAISCTTNGHLNLFEPRSSDLFVYSARDKAISRWDTAHCQNTGTLFSLPEFIDQTAIQPNGSLLATIYKQSLQIYDIKTRKLIYQDIISEFDNQFRESGVRKNINLSFSPDGHFLLLSGSSSKNETASDMMLLVSLWKISSQE